MSAHIKTKLGRPIKGCHSKVNVPVSAHASRQVSMEHVIQYHLNATTGHPRRGGSTRRCKAEFRIFLRVICYVDEYVTSW